MIDELFPPEAAWIGSAHPFDLHEVYLDFRSPVFPLDQRPRQALIHITADSRYRVWVNGRLAGRGPARCWPWRQAVDVIDITALLADGANRLAVQVYQPGYSHFAYVHRAAAGVLAALWVDGVAQLWTDSRWRVRRSPVFAGSAPRVSIYGSGVEMQDLVQDDDWPSARFDDGGWQNARIVAPAYSDLWSGLHCRELPLLTERSLPLHAVETRRGIHVGPIADAHFAICALWPAARAAEITQEPDNWWRPQLHDGEGAAWLFDLGRDYTCQGWFEVEGAAGGETVLVSYAEKLRDGQLVLSDPATYCRVRLTDGYALRPGAQAADPFTWRGGRYLLFALVGPAGPELRMRFHARGAQYPLAATKALTTGDAELDGIAAMCENTLHACLQDGFVDSCWRESSQWVGDALPQALILAALSDDVRPLRQVIAMAAAGAYPDGVLPSVLPGEVHAYTIVDYNFMWVELLALYQQLTGDDGFVHAHWPVLTRLLERFHADRGQDSLLLSQPGRRLFLDWAPVSRREPSAIYNLHYLLALQTAAQLADRLGAAGGAIWRERATALQAAARAAFWDGSRWWDDRERTTYSQLAAALAVLTGSAAPLEVPALLAAIVVRSLDLDDGPQAGAMVLASPFMHHYLFEALHQGGRSADVVAIIRRRWGRWLRDGCPTTWENWNVDFPDGSQCHAFSAHPRYHLAVCLGHFAR